MLKTSSHSNWPSDFAELKKLEDVLQCSICYDYISTCMITPCSHNFCSLCIRKYLQFKTQCPTCFGETHGSDLRKNRLVDDIISIWVKLKDLLLFNVRLAAMTQSVKLESRLSNNIDSPTDKLETKPVKKDLVTPKNERSKKSVVQKLFSEKKAISPEGAEAKSIVIDGVIIPSIFQPQKSPKKYSGKKSEDKSTCPVCNVEIPLKNVNMHLDSCLAASDPPSRLKQKPEKREPIPKRVYSLMKEKDLKKCLKDYGLNPNGDRKAMIARLTRYIVLYNAECDKEEPKPVAEILKQVEREERDEKATQSNPLFQTTRPPTIPPEKKKDPEAIEKANKEYLDQNREYFNKLIENMRARDGKNIKPLKPLNRIDSDDENEEKASPGKPEVPSCSNDGSEKETRSIYSQETITGSDSDSDIFDNSPVKSESALNGPHLIDWEKTQINEDPELDTQITDPQTKDVIIIEDDQSNSYDSVFLPSPKSELSKTPRSKLSLSARKKSKVLVTSTNFPSTTNMATTFSEIFEENNENEVSPAKKAAVVNSEIVEEAECIGQIDKDTEEETDINENTDVDTEEEEESDTEEEKESEEEEDDFTPLRTPGKNHDVSPEISPMKTRSSKKRKSQTLEEKVTNSPSSGTPSTRRKRVKPSTSPVH